MKIKHIGVDLAKNSFQLHGGIKGVTNDDAKGHTVKLKKKVNRTQFKRFIESQKGVTFYMEACGGAHYWARKVAASGNTPLLIPPQRAKSWVIRQKNDARDAEAIYKCGLFGDFFSVNVKTVHQQDVQSLIRFRAGTVEDRTAAANRLRGIMGEYGVVVSQGPRALRNFILQLQNGSVDPADLGDMSSVTVRLVIERGMRLLELDKDIEKFDQDINAIIRSCEVCQRLMEIPGIGPLTAATLYAAVGNCATFKNARQLAAWLGLTPRQNSTGGKQTLLGITKAGNKYLRTLLIHGGRTVLLNASKKTDPRSRWAMELKERVGNNKAAVALANKNARTIWAILTRGERYDPNYRSRHAKKASAA